MIARRHRRLSGGVQFREIAAGVTPFEGPHWVGRRHSAPGQDRAIADVSGFQLDCPVSAPRRRKTDFRLSAHVQPLLRGAGLRRSANAVVHANRRSDVRILASLAHRRKLDRRPFPDQPVELPCVAHQQHWRAILVRC